VVSLVYFVYTLLELWDGVALPDGCQDQRERRVRRALSRQVSPVPTIREIAEHMMISPRTLQRYLMAQGTGFQELLDNTRQAMAARYICDSSISLTRLASLLGYADLSAFSRAFTR
jgi:AraC-like DNA-binding protein